MQTVVAVTRAMEKGACTQCADSAFDITGLQVAANQEYAQAVDHVRPTCYLKQVHFHVVPAPLPNGSSSVLNKWDAPATLTMLGRRDELTQEEGDELASRVQEVLDTKAKL